MPFDRKAVRTLVLMVAFGVVLNACAQNLDAVRSWANWIVGVLSPILSGLVLAFILNIPMVIFERHVFKPRGKRLMALKRAVRRPLSMLFSVLLLVAVVVLVSAIVVPQLIESVSRIFVELPNWVEAAKAGLSQFEGQLPELIEWVDSINFDWSAMQSAILEFLRTGLNLTLGTVASAATSMFGTAANAAISFVFALSALAAKEQLISQVQRLVRAFIKPGRAERIIEISSITNRAFSGFVAGQVIEACILGTLCFLGMTLIGFPNALLISTLVAVGAVVPIFGAFVSAFVGALLIAAAEGLMRGLGFVLFFVILQQLEGNLIYPRVMGSRIGLPAIWVLAAITVGGGLMGILGMLLCIPTFAVLYTLLREAVAERTRKNGQLGGGANGHSNDQRKSSQV